MLCIALFITALCAQTQTKIGFESVAKQRFQNLSFCIQKYAVNMLS